MNAVALALLVSGVGVGFGWRPMPDGSPRYEYVVQIEPEMLEALSSGQAIPIVAEVPPEIQAIGRIRIVVGRDDLPREQGVTRLRPIGEGGADGDPSTVELTQYSEAAPRYGAPVPPPEYSAGPTAATFDPYTEVPPTAGGAPASAWNAGAAETNPLRVADASADAGGSAWNGAAGGAPATDATSSGPLARVGEGLRDATAPVREGIDQFSGQVRGAADDLGQRTQDLLEDLRPEALFGGGAAAPAPAAGAAATVPPVWNAGADAAAAPVWNGGAADAAAPSDVAAEGAAPGTSWNDAAIGGAPDASEAPPLVTTDGAPAVARGADANPWDNAADPRFRGGPTAGEGPTTAAGGAGAMPPPWPGTTPIFPESAGAVGDAPIAAGDLGTTGGAGPVLEGATGPPVLSEMLDQAATRPLDGAASLLDMPAPPTDVAAVPAAGTATTPAAAAGAPSTATTPGADARHRAAVILAWVLLSGSAAGNIYLFWSYLDVRTKYRALVRKTARAVGSRFSAA